MKTPIHTLTMTMLTALLFAGTACETTGAAQAPVDTGTGTSTERVDRDPPARRDAMIDDLYSAFAEGASPRELRKVDKAEFAERCDRIGRGAQSVRTGDDYQRRFFGSQRVKSACAEVARLDSAIDEYNHAP